jgi:hypothetical protein
MLSLTEEIDMGKKMVVEVKVRLILTVNDDVGMDDLDTIMSEMDYTFMSQSDNATVYNSTIEDYELRDVR